MKTLKVFGHIGLVLVLLFLTAGLPILTHFDVFGGQDAADAVSQASVALPDQPSGAFVVLINNSLHPDTMEDWKAFFTDADELPVIFENISCIVAEGDANGRQLAERFQIQLPENQMTLREENPTLLVSKAEAGLLDVAVFSKEMAEALKLAPAEQLNGLTVIELTGGE